MYEQQETTQSYEERKTLSGLSHMNGDFLSQYNFSRALPISCIEGKGGSFNCSQFGDG